MGKRKPLPYLEVAGKETIIYTGPKGERVLTSLGKDAISEVAVENIKIPEGSRVLILNAKDGRLGIPLASRNPRTVFYLNDDDEANREIIERNIEANADLQERDPVNNICYITAQGIEDKVAQNRGFDMVVFSPQTHVGLEVGKDQIRIAKNSLRKGGELNLITHKKRGGERYLQMLVEVFGSDNVKTSFLGKGGYRIYGAINTEETAELKKERACQRVVLELAGIKQIYTTESGLFSKEGLDSGTELLLKTIFGGSNRAEKNYQRILDLGCGWGPIGGIAAALYPEAEVILVDSSQRAVKVAAVNIKNNCLSNAKAIASGNISRDLKGKFDLILSNPPLHLNRPQLIELFRGARSKLGRNGVFLIVVEKSHEAKFTGILNNVFGKYREVLREKGGGSEYIIFESRK